MTSSGDPLGIPREERFFDMALGKAIATMATAVAISTQDAEKKLLGGLNPEQKEIVLHDKGPILAAAVAGSGKTHTLVNRVGYLTAVRGVNPRRVLAVTFSRKGAEEMNERLVSLIGDTGARVGTFHSLALQILREEGRIKDWTIDDRDRYRYCVKDAVSWQGMKWTRADLTLLVQYISLCKCALARPMTAEAEAIAQDIRAKNPRPSTVVEKMMEAYDRAEEVRKERMIITFDDMLFDACELLSNDEGLRVRWASKWDYVLQDEAQDQNLGQLLLGELLAKDHRNYMLVGDPAQTIYTWRGARPEKLLGFEEKWDAKKVIMSRNYRCGQEIIGVANKVLESMDPATRLDTQMICELGTTAQVTCRQFEDLDEEAESIGVQIKEALESGVKARDIGILYRTNAQSRGPEEALIGLGIPYRIIGGVNFYERKEVKDLLAYLRLAEGRGSLDDVARCINAPFRYLGKAFVGRVREATKKARVAARKNNGRISYPALIKKVAQQEGIQARQRYSVQDWADMIELCHSKIQAGEKPARILEQIILDTQYIGWLTRDQGEESTENSRVSNVREMVRAAERFPTTKGLLDYIDKTLKASKDQKSKNKNPNKVTLTTIHRSKGGEFPVVFSIGVNEGILPHARAEEPEEERRLFYVAVTRAMNELHISCVRQAAIGNRVLALSPSPFIKDAGLVIESDPQDIAFGDPRDV